MDEESIFAAALGKGSPQERQAFLAEACSDDLKLRSCVEALLRAHENPDSFLEPRVAGGSLTMDEPPASEQPGMVIGPYKLLEQIGEGGMGEVWLAEQTAPVKRHVALKLIKPGMDSAQVIDRFKWERQALALMDHPNIAKVFDGGTTARGLPYFVMEYVKGVPITEYCDQRKLNPRERLKLFVPVCQAVQHAHQKGIIHRDLKPSNILVADNDGKPAPKVIDFGVAKALGQEFTDLTKNTVIGAVVGTFEYMAPEQAEVSRQGVDTRADIYSLGVLLYELLTGTTPFRERFKKATFTDILRMIREEEPPSLSAQLTQSRETLSAVSAKRQMVPARLLVLVRGDLDRIALKCQVKDRTGRYETAAALAREVQRYLADEPLEETGRPSTVYRLRKLARKHRAALAVCGAFVLLLLAGTAMSTWQAVRATRAEQQMQAERDRAQMALTRQVADRLDGELKQLAVVAHTIEAVLAETSLGEDGLEKLLRRLLTNDTRIHGVTLAYKDNEGPKKDQPYCLYVFRTSTMGVDKKFLRPPGYDYQKWDWFKKPIDFKKPHWTGPGFDDPSKVWMVAYSVPLWRDGNAVGVLCLDLELAYFTRIWDWLDELNLGKKSYGFVVNGTGSTAGAGKDTTGVFVCHPKYGAGNVAGQSPKKITELERDVLREKVDPAFTALTRRILKGETGRETAIDPATGKRSTFLFTPVPSTGWSFVAVVED
jgi:serine/threonine protein kinase